MASRLPREVRKPALEHFPTKWIPVRRRKCGKIKHLEKLRDCNAIVKRSSFHAADGIPVVTLLSKSLGHNNNIEHAPMMFGREIDQAMSITVVERQGESASGRRGPELL